IVWFAWTGGGERYLAAVRYGADPALAASLSGGGRAYGSHRALARGPGSVPRGVYATHGDPLARRLGIHGNQFRTGYDRRAPEARIDGPSVRRLPGPRGRRSSQC